MSTTLRDSKLIELCTPSINYDARVKSACEAIDPQLYEIIDDTNGVPKEVVGDQPSMPNQGIIMIPSIMDIYDEKLIDILAWQFHVDFYDQARSRDLEFRKRLVQLSIVWHKTKGTVDLVQDVLDTYWPGGAQILEWFEYMSPMPPGHVPPTNPPYSTLQSPPIVPAAVPSWHDRYRFRIYIDENIIDPGDEEQVLRLIDNYKPISRWCEGIFRATNSDCQIAWAGAMLRFVIRASETPDRQIRAEEYHMAGPTSGAAATLSDLFTVTLPTLSASDVFIVTPNDGGAGGTFEPPTVKLSSLNPTAHFSYVPASAGAKTITVTNDSGLTDPTPVVYTVKLIAETFTLVGPASGFIGQPSTVFTVALPTNTITAGPVTITPNDNGAGGTFTPASVQLQATVRSWREKTGGESATFIYTPAP